MPRTETGYGSGVIPEHWPRRGTTRLMVAYDTPEEAARGLKASADVLALDVAPDSSWAVVLVDKGEPEQPYLLQVLCRRTAGGWEEYIPSNGHGWFALPEGNPGGVGVHTLWDDAPPGAKTVSIRWRGELHDAPVHSGYYLYVAWYVPDSESGDQPALA